MFSQVYREWYRHMHIQPSFYGLPVSLADSIFVLVPVTSAAKPHLKGSKSTDTIVDLWHRILIFLQLYAALIKRREI